uniref:C2H2-type domain-containing protein n=1 Tax=Oryzias latipes TaxID=8090 RepID=A0A3P9M447_ORYLA
PSVERNPFRFSEDKASESLQADTDDSVDSDFWKDDRKPQSNLNSLKHETSETGVKYVTDLKPHSCPQCSKAFRYSSYLKIHMRQHTERYFCSVCGHKSTSSSNLKVHMRTHTGEKPFSCEICCFLLKHVLSVCACPQDNRCGYCGEFLNSADGLTAHLRFHQKSSKTCSFCGKTFTSILAQELHVRLHTGEKPYSCHVCGKKFTQKGNLTSHLHVHASEKPFKCKECPRAFCHLTSLERHVREHNHKSLKKKGSEHCLVGLDDPTPNVKVPRIEERLHKLGTHIWIAASPAFVWT